MEPLRTSRTIVGRAKPAAVATPTTPQGNITYQTSSSTTIPIPTGATQLTMFIVGGGMGGNGYTAPVLSSFGYVYYGGAGGGGGALAVGTFNASDISTDITVSTIGAGSAGAYSGGVALAGGHSIISFTWRSHTLTITCGGGFPDPTFGSNSMLPGWGGQMSITYGGAGLPPIIGYSGNNGGPPSVQQAFAVGGSDVWYSSYGLGGPGWMISSLASPNPGVEANGWGGGGMGGDGKQSAGPNPGSDGIFALIY